MFFFMYLMCPLLLPSSAFVCALVHTQTRALNVWAPYSFSAGYLLFNRQSPFKCGLKLKVVSFCVVFFSVNRLLLPFGFFANFSHSLNYYAVFRFKLIDTFAHGTFGGRALRLKVNHLFWLKKKSDQMVDKWTPNGLNKIIIFYPHFTERDKRREKARV